MTATVERRLPAGTTDHVIRRLFPEPNRFEDDPDGWARERLGVESWSKPREIRDSVVANRYTAVQAGHECAKSHTVASLVCWWVDVHDPEDTLVVSTAPVHHQVQGVLWSEITGMHEAGGLEGKLTGTHGQAIPEWYIGDRRVAFGRAPDKPSYFQGYHAKYMLVIIDEAGEVPDWLFHRAESLAANEHSRIVAVGNPYDPGAYFAEVCAPGSNWNVIQLGAFDTPRWSGEPVSGDLIERLVSDEYVRRMRSFGEDSALYQTTVLGRFPDVSDDTLFPPRILRKATSNELAGLDRGGYGVDVARYGEDETCVYRNRGGQIRLVDAWRKQDTEETADRVELILEPNAAAGVSAFIDAVGIGAGVFDKLKRREMPVMDFNAGERALEPDRFVNRRAEVFWTLREAMDDGRVDLDPEDKELLAQLGRIKWKQVSGGRVQIESKDDMRKRGVKSPDRADAAARAYATPVTVDEAPPPERELTSLTADLFERTM